MHQRAVGWPHPLVAGVLGKMVAMELAHLEPLSVPDMRLQPHVASLPPGVLLPQAPPLSPLLPAWLAPLVCRAARRRLGHLRKSSGLKLGSVVATVFLPAYFPLMWAKECKNALM